MLPNDYDWDFERIGRRFSHRRRELGLTLEEVSKAAEISRFTLMRIERGFPTKGSTIHKIRKCLRLYTDQLTVRPHQNEFYEVHRMDRTRWMVSVPKQSYSKTEEQPSIHVDDEDERHRLGQLGFQPFYTAILESELSDGSSGHAFMELHKSSWIDSHYGEEFIYAVRGDSAITVNADVCILREGDSMCFDARHPHSYAPASPVESGQLAPRILIVVSSRQIDRELALVESPMPAPSVKG